jgi:hypothetical protein
MVLTGAAHAGTAIHASANLVGAAQPVMTGYQLSLTIVSVVIVLAVVVMFIASLRGRD